MNLKIKGLWLQKYYKELFKRYKFIGFFQIYSFNQKKLLINKYCLNNHILVKNNILKKNLLKKNNSFLNGSIILIFYNSLSQILNLQKEFFLDFLVLFYKKLGISNLSFFSVFLNYDKKDIFKYLIYLILNKLKNVFNLSKIMLLLFKCLYKKII